MEMMDSLSSLPVVWSVSSLNRAVKNLLEREFTSIWVAGEISNLTVASSGHWYFSLKDAGAQVRSVMFRNRAILLPFRPREGMRVEARVSAGLYEARGEFQLNIEAMRPAGLGTLHEAFERLKAELQAAGWFAAERKQPLPSHPCAIGIVTSPQAAALRDIVATLQRRAPHIPLVLYPTPVQGEGAAEKIAEALALANRRAEVDVLLLARGGGSIEDLWAFNEKVVASALVASRLPVVCGVGHETDVTIADFVADVRAATPTAAAELVAPEREAMLRHLRQQAQMMRRQLEQLTYRRMQQLDYLARRLVHPGERLKQQEALLVLRARQMQRAAGQILQGRRWALERLAARYQRQVPAVRERLLDQAVLARRLQMARNHLLDRLRARLEHLASRLEAINPSAVLARGYSLVQAEDGKLVHDVAQLRRGDKVTLRFAVGEAGAHIVDLPLEQGRLFE